MTPLHDFKSISTAQRLVLAAGLFGLLVLVVRITGLVVNPSSLYADETQYWVWSRDLDWGYFSKPPLIAWIIAATTSVFGDSDWAIRLAAPLLHTATALLLALSADRLFGRVPAAWTFIAWITLPSVWLSAAVISTDAVLLTCWSLALYGFIRLRDGAGWSATVMLGTGFGLGMLAKYAMGYFAAGLALAAILDPISRRALLQPRLLAAGALALVIIAPNLIWNWRNDFATVSHTAANANWGADMFNPGEAISFVIDQLAVFGPAFVVVLVASVIVLFRQWRTGRADPRLIVLACFCVPAILVVTGQAFLSRAHANWAASAYAAATIIVVAVLLQGPRWRRWILAGSIALHTIAGISLATLAMSPALTEQVGLANAFKRVRGWPETATALAEAVKSTGVQTLVFDNRNDFHQMQRYGGAINAELYIWMRYAGITNHAEQGWALPAGFEGPVLIASERPLEVPVMAFDFAQMERAGDIRIDLGGGRERHYQLVIARDYRPVVRTDQFEEAVRLSREARDAALQ
jgi:4-amino-4-deoxy-L-arabinose transferase-like glycosyltransferase